MWTLGVSCPRIPSGAQGAYGHVFAGITATTGFQNDGFTDTAQTGSTVNTFWPLFIVSAGYAVPIDVVRLSGTVFKPITDPGSPVNYSVGFMLTLGRGRGAVGAAAHGDECRRPDPAPPESPPAQAGMGGYPSAQAGMWATRAARP